MGGLKIKLENMRLSGVSYQDRVPYAEAQAHFAYLDSGNAKFDKIPGDFKKSIVSVEDEVKATVTTVAAKSTAELLSEQRTTSAATALLDKAVAKQDEILKAIQTPFELRVDKITTTAEHNKMLSEAMAEVKTAKAAVELAAEEAAEQAAELKNQELAQQAKAAAQEISKVTKETEEAAETAKTAAAEAEAASEAADSRCKRGC